MARASTVDLPRDMQDKKQEGEDREHQIRGVSIHQVTQISLVDSDLFASVMGGIVMINVVFIGFETEFGHRSEIFGAINNGFLLAYVIELMMRLLTHGLKALRDVFTIMDVVLVFLSFIDRIMASSGMGRALPTFRTFRLSRLLRNSRMFRESRELRAIAVSTQRLLKTLVWVMLFLFFALWIMATFAHMVIGRSAEWNETLDPAKTFDPFVALDIQQYFGTVCKSFVTLLQFVTLSQWAPHVARPVSKVYPITFAFFVMFLFVTTYSLLIAIVSNLVQDSMAASKQNAAAIKDRQRNERRKCGVKARDLLAEVDADGSGQLDEDEIRYALEVTDLADILRDLGVPVSDAPSLVRLLDYSGDGQVSYDELVEGIVKMDEDITKRDYAMMGFWVKNLLNRCIHLEERLGRLCDNVSFIRKRLAGSFDSLNHMIRTSKDTQLRQRSIKILRTSGPALPPSLEKKIIVKPTLGRRDPKDELVTFTSRFLGEPPKPKRAGSPGLEENRQIALFHNTMQEAPPHMDIALRRAKRAEMAWADKYAISKDLGIGNPESQHLRVLKRTL